MTDSEGVRYHDEATTWFACLCGNESTVKNADLR
jgi:hypothetical protein